MPDSLHEAAALLGIAPVAPASAEEVRTGIERQLGARLPDAVASLLQFPGLVAALAATYSCQPGFPDHLRLARPDELPGRSGPVLWLMTENQGVCKWGVPLDAGEAPPVLVGGDLETGEVTVEYAPSIAAFAVAFAWDGRLMAREPLIRAQAAPLDDRTLAVVRAEYRERLSTAGWPGRTNLRFEGDGGFALELWSAPQQCDWWMAADDPSTLASAVAKLARLSDLEESLWSNEVPGQELLARVLQQSR